VHRALLTEKVAQEDRLTTHSHGNDHGKSGVMAHCVLQLIIQYLLNCKHQPERLRAALADGFKISTGTSEHNLQDISRVH